MMFKEKYSKLHTDRISVSLSPLMEASKIQAATKNDEWKERTIQETMGIDNITFPSSNSSNSNPNPSKENFWETEF